jgi:acetylornithine deacetylase/succinyl-diaminopimelate desuccinylase-like protein
MSSLAIDEVTGLCQDLIRIDTTNTGDLSTSAGERVAAEYVAEKLSEVGIEPTVLESAPGRANVIARLPGSDPSRGALLVHGHLDVVPADASEWSVHPFSGELRDGFLWGRGAVDMKDFDAMMLAVVRGWQRSGYVPPRDIVLCFTADEEAGSDYGATFLVNEHPALFDGCTEAIGEVGGFSFTVSNDLRLYLVQTAEKGIDWLRVHATGRPGHGSFVHDDNAVTVLSEAVARVGRHRFPVVVTPTVRSFLEQVADALQIDLDPDNPEQAIDKLGPIATIIGATIRNTANPTGLSAGYKHNVIPGKASATIDCRTVPWPVRVVPRATAGGARARHRDGAGAPPAAAGDDLRRCPGRRHGRGAAGGRSRRARRALYAVRRHGRQAVRPDGHPLLRLLAAETARRPELLGVVPWH